MEELVDLICYDNYLPFSQRNELVLLYLAAQFHPLELASLQVCLLSGNLTVRLFLF